METTYYQDISVNIENKKLSKMAYHMVKEGLQLFWGFANGKMVLDIYNKQTNNKFIFIRHKGYFELVEVYVRNKNVLLILNEYVDFSFEMSKSTMIKRDRYQEIDSLLATLFESLKQKDIEKVTMTKSLLKELTNEMDKQNK